MTFLSYIPGRDERTGGQGSGVMGKKGFEVRLADYISRILRGLWLAVNRAGALYGNFTWPGTEPQTLDYFLR